MRIFVTGATGFIGSRLIRDLLRRGDSVVALTRDGRRLRPRIDDEGGLVVVEGDPAQRGPWQERLAGCDAVVALAGEPIAGRRWSAALKARAERSRVGGLERTVEAIGQLPAADRPKVLLSASGADYYGDRGDELLDEQSGPGRGFLAELCQRWEAAARPAEALGLRTCQLRLGVVLGAGGALAKMVPAFRAFLGGPIGSGTQHLPWIHLSDVARLILFLLDHEGACGPINVTAPEPVTMGEFAAALGRALGRPAIVPVPGPLLRLALGEAASVVLGSKRAIPKEAQRLGYRFLFPDLDGALRDLLGAP